MKAHFVQLLQETDLTCFTYTKKHGGGCLPAGHGQDNYSVLVLNSCSVY